MRFSALRLLTSSWRVAPRPIIASRRVTEDIRQGYSGAPEPDNPRSCYGFDFLTTRDLVIVAMLVAADMKKHLPPVEGASLERARELPPARLQIPVKR